MGWSNNHIRSRTDIQREMVHIQDSFFKINFFKNFTTQCSHDLWTISEHIKMWLTSTPTVWGDDYIVWKSGELSYTYTIWPISLNVHELSKFHIKMQSGLNQHFIMLNCNLRKEEGLEMWASISVFLITFCFCDKSHPIYGEKITHHDSD